MTDQTQTYRVICNGALTDSARAALASTPIEVQGHGVGAIGPGAKLPEPDRHSFIVPAGSADEAVDSLRQVLEPVGGFGRFEADPRTPLG